MIRRLSALSLGLLLGTALTACHAPPQPASTPATAPVKGEEVSTLGQPAPGKLIALHPEPTMLPGHAARITYYSTDALHPGKMVTVSAMVVTPEGPAPAGGWPVLAWEHGTTGLAAQCGPSEQGFGTSALTKPYLTLWLRRGFAIVATDYPGMGIPGTDLYLNARAEGMSALDAVRAMTAADARLSRDVIIAGHSQGAQAAVAAAGLAPDYAPMLHVKGTIGVGTPYFTPRSAKALLAAPKGPAARHFSPSLVFTLMLGASLGEADPTFDPGHAFTPKALPYYAMATKECLGAFYTAVEKSGLTPATMFRHGAGKALRPALAWTVYPTVSLKAPLFLAIGSKDTIVPPIMQKTLEKAACAAGTTVTAKVYPKATHTSSLMASANDAATFAQNLLRGAAPTSTCPAPASH